MGDSMSGPHILIVNVLYAPNTYGGATVVAEQVSHALMRNHNCRISAVSLISRDDLLPYTVIKSEVRGQASYLINVPLNRPYAQRHSNPHIAQTVGQLIDAISPNLVHVHCVQDVGAGVIEATKARDLPVVLSVHDFWWICERQFMIGVDGRYCGQSPVTLQRCRGCVENLSAARTRQAALMRQASLADVITYPSQFARVLCEESGMPKDRGIVWRNGVQMPGFKFKQEQEARRAQDGRLAFGYLGGPAHIKGWPDIRAAFTAQKQSDFTVHLVDGSRDGSWWRDHNFADLPGTWQIHGRFDQDQMDTFYARIDVLLFISQWKETFGLAIREALARGIRVIQTDSGGTTEHGALDPSCLIPIGAGPLPLAQRITDELSRTTRGQPTVLVDSFDDQAQALMKMVHPLLSRLPSTSRSTQHGTWGSVA
ncbi:glycosyltransferase [Roseovarius aestuarii]|nr:glycosyltransferase [Roseovarius aestuarii]